MARRMAALVALVAVMTVVHLTIVRPWYLRWGAREVEIARTLPGDELSPSANSVATRAVTIDAPAPVVWAWIAQIGQQRSGFYSYRLLENIIGAEMPRVHQLEPTLQTISTGDKVWMYPPDRLGGVGHAIAARVEPERALVLATAPLGADPDEKTTGTWAFVLEPIDGAHTRLIVRSRSVDPASLGALAFVRLGLEPAHYVMERKMMTTLKALAEGQNPPELPDVVQAGLWLGLALLFVVAAVGVVVGYKWPELMVAAAAAATAAAIATLVQPPVALTICLTAAALVQFAGGSRSPAAEWG